MRKIKNVYICRRVGYTDICTIGQQCARRCVMSWPGMSVRGLRPVLSKKSAHAIYKGNDSPLERALPIPKTHHRLIQPTKAIKSPSPLYHHFTTTHLRLQPAMRLSISTLAAPMFLLLALGDAKNCTVGVNSCGDVLSSARVRAYNTCMRECIKAAKGND